MRAREWRSNTRIFIVSGFDDASTNNKWNGRTTDRPPYRDGNISKVDIVDDDGSLRAVALGRVKYVTDCV